jgi:uncharacterized RDD family membrane protein YckC
MAIPDYLISTPENVDLHLEFAGLGNRILACVIDTLLSYLMVVVVAGAAYGIYRILETFGFSETYREWVTIMLIAGFSFVSFMVIFGYFVFFEILWRGQTPGKRVVGIRVIESNGQPVSGSAVWIRNLVRSLDESLFLIGLLSMLIDRNERRLGDLAANTIVIRERPSNSSENLQLTATLSSEDSLDAGLITPQEYEILTNFLRRRKMMASTHRPEVAKKLSDHFRIKLNQDEAQVANNPEMFLEKIVLAYRARAED